ncbi:uncharacterized protein LOC144434071 isoform X2 [Glandiceps talaboti]
MTVDYSVIIATTHSVFDTSGISIRIQLVGDTVVTEPILLQTTTGHREAKIFESGNTDTFRIRAQNIDAIKQVKIGFDETGFVEGWKLNHVAIENLSTLKKYIFKLDGDLQKWHDGTLTVTASTTANNCNDDEENENNEVVDFLMGPILGIRSLALADEYHLCCLVMTKSDVHLLPPVTFEYTTADGTVSSHGSGEEIVLETLNDKRLWRYDWSIPRHDTKEITCTYYLPDGRCYTCIVPAKVTPIRFVLASSADVSSSSDKRMRNSSRNSMWKQMRREHINKSFHLLILAGDQVNADDLLTEKPSLIAWTQLTRKERMKEDFTNQMKRESHDFYFNLYYERWRQPEPAWIYARIPSFMMWNNFDILNGYGSMVSYPVIDGIYEVARKYFSLFQLRGLRQDKDWNSSMDNISSPYFTMWLHPESRNGDDTKYTTLTFLIRLGEVAFLVDNLKHLFVVSGVPFIFPETHLFPNMDSSLQVPWKKEWEYDYADSWDATVSYDVDRLRLFTLLSDFSFNKRSRVSVLSGGVYAACWGRLYTETGVVIEMPTSSPLVDEPLALLDGVIAKCNSCDRDIEVPGHGRAWSTMTPVGTEKDAPTILRARNFFSFIPFRDKGELFYKSQVISQETQLFGRSDKPHIFTNVIRPFHLEKKSPPDDSTCVMM